MTSTDTKLLLALTTELNTIDACNLAGISYEYGKKRISLLKKQGYIRARQVGQQVYYSTIRTLETESVFNTTEYKTGTTKEYHFVFQGEYTTLPLACNKVVTSLTTIKKSEDPLITITGKLLNTLRVRSFRKAQGYESSQPPDETTIKEYLFQRIRLARQELQIAEELLNANILWTGNSNVWKLIHNQEPTERAQKQYEEIGDSL